MKKIFFLMMCSLYCIGTIGQSITNPHMAEDSVMTRAASSSASMDAYFNLGRVDVIPSSPHSQTFERLVNHEISEYNGLPDIRIPLYEVSIKGLTIPIELVYHAGGVRYRDYDGEVGSGWSLSAGGYRIARQVNGTDDLSYPMYDDNAWQNLHHDVNAGTKTNLHLDDFLTRLVYTSEEMWDIKPSTFGTSEDGECDMFTYMLPNTSGHFIFPDRRQSGSSVMRGECAFIEPNRNRLNSISHWEANMTDAAGFTYEFGYPKINPGPPTLNDYDNGFVEWRNIHDWGTPAVNTAWCLREITSPYNDEKINFSYRRFFSGYNDPGATVKIKEPLWGNHLWVKPEPWKVDPRELDAYERFVNPYINAEVLTEYNTSKIYLSNFIDKIETGDCIVEFVRNTPQEWHNTISQINIVDKHTRERIRTFKFSYTQVLNHILLSKISVCSGEGKIEKSYTMDYYQPNATATLQQFCPDQWGFYKRNTAIPGFDPIHSEFKNDRYLSNITFYYSTYLPVFRELYQDVPNIFIDRTVNNGPEQFYFSLKKITYPTGGYTEYEYEPHKYKLGAKETTGGGQRIKKITSHPGGDAKPIITTYKYGTAENGFGVPNMDWNKNLFVNQYYFFCQGNPWYGTITGEPGGNHMAGSITVQTVRTYSTRPIHVDYSHFRVYYPEVAVYRMSSRGNAENGKTVSKYDIQQEYVTDYMFYSSYAGSDPFGMGPKPLTGDEYSFPQVIYDYRPGNKPLLRNRIYYNSENRPEREETFVYSRTQLRNIKGLKVYQKFFYPTIWSNHPQFSYYPYHYISTANNYIDTNITLGIHNLVKHTTTSYDGESPLTKTVSFTYDNLSRISKQTTENIPHGNNTSYTIEEEFSYPVSQHHNVLVSNNMLNTIIEKKKTTSLAGRIAQIRYGYITNYMLPLSISTAGSGGLLAEVWFDLYDSHGNIRQFTTIDDLTTVILWGYGHKYPIAEIKNAKYTEVTAILGGSVSSLESTVRPTDSYIRYQVERLRQGLPQAMVTTYTYKPLVGMTSYTDPKGVIHDFAYDEFGRLASKEFREAENSVKSLLEFYEYNYENK